QPLGRLDSLEGPGGLFLRRDDDRDVMDRVDRALEESLLHAVAVHFLEDGFRLGLVAGFALEDALDAQQARPALRLLSGGELLGAVQRTRFPGREGSTWRSGSRAGNSDAWPGNSNRAPRHSFE